MNTIVKKLLVTSAIISSAIVLIPSNADAAACGVDYTADCEVTGDITALAVIGNAGADVTVTIEADTDIIATVDALAGAQGTFIITDNGTRTITQTAAIGGTNAIDSITVSATDTWVASADLDTNDGFIFSATGGSLEVTAGTFASDIVGGNAGDNATFTGGTVTGNINFGNGTDLVALDGSVITGTLDGGSSSDDSLTLGADFSTANTIAGFELIDLAGNRLTVANSITGAAATTGTGLFVNDGNLDINSGGSIGGTIYDSSGGGDVGTVTFGADGAGGTFNIDGLIEDVNLVINSGTVNTNGNSLGGGGLTLGNLTVNADARLEVRDNITSGAALTNDGTIFIEAGNTLTVDAHDPSTGTFIIGLSYNPDNEITSFGSIVVGGDGFEMVSADTMQLEIPTTSGVLPEETEIRIVEGDAAINNGPGNTLTAITDNSFLYDSFIINGVDMTDVDADADENDLYLRVTRKNLGSVSTTSNNNTVASALYSSLSTSTDVDILELQASLTSATTQSQFNDRLESILPTVDGAARAAGITTADNTISLTASRLAGLRQNRTVSGMSSGGVTEGVNAWLQPFAQTAKQDIRDGVDGYESETYGIAGGFDNSSIFENTVLGVALAIANTDSDSDSTNVTESEIDSFMISIYGDHDIDDRTYLNAQFGYTYNDVRSTRYNLGGIAGNDALVDYGTDQFSTYLEVGRDYEWGAYTTLTPAISLGHSYSNADDYRETGAGGAGLIVDTSDSSKLDIGVGVDASWLYRKRSGSYLKPEISAKLEYDVIGDAVETETTFVGGGSAGPKMQLNGSDPAQLSLNTGVGFTYLARANWEISSHYNYEYKEDFSAHAGSMKFSYKF